MELLVLVRCILEPIQTELLVNEVDENIYELKATQSQEPSETITPNIVKPIPFKVAAVLEKLETIL